MSFGSCHFCYKNTMVNDEGFCEKCEKKRNKCHYCGQLFVKGYGSFCDKNCHLSYERNRYKPKGKRIGEIIICDNCGKSFSKKTTNQLRCSEQCSKEKAEFLQNKSRLEIFNRDEFRCIYCGKSSIEDFLELHVDHIFPEVLGGRSIMSNLVTSCLRCNLEKNKKLLKVEVRRRIYKQVRIRNNMLGIHPIQLAKLK